MAADEGEDDRLRAAALQTAQSILQMRLRGEQELLEAKETLEEERRILELLNRAGASLASTLDLQAVLQGLTDIGTELSGAQFGAFFYNVTDAQGASYQLYTLSGVPREAFEGFGQPRATPLFGPTFRGEAAIRLGDVTRDPRYGQWGPHHGMPAGHLAVRSYLAVPVVARSGQVLGGLFFGHSTPDVFTERVERLVLGIAAQGAVAIDNARLYEEARGAVAAERAARAEVERVSVMKDQFLATLSHELRTPLNAILGWSQIVLLRGRLGQEDRHGLETIARNARAQAQMIDDLLDMNRIVSGKLRLDVQRVELAGIIDAALEGIQPSADAKAIRVRRTLDPNAGPVSGDPHRLQQIVWNLVTNAVKFTPKGGQIDVLLQRVNSHVEVVVHDTGVGIGPDFLPHVFERFRQADASTTRPFAGLGLGLSIVKQLVELHGGTVHAQSPGEGLGATFTVRLPLRALRHEEPSAPREHPTSSVASPGARRSVSLAGLRVLVVDDEVDARELVKAALSAAGAEALLAGSAAEALDAVRQRRPDVIVSDIGMPGRDGYQLMEDVRRLEPDAGGDAPAIAVTAFARTEDRTRAMLAGYQVHMAKPIEPQELVATILSLARRGRGR